MRFGWGEWGISTYNCGRCQYVVGDLCMLRLHLIWHHPPFATAHPSCFPLERYDFSVRCMHNLGSVFTILNFPGHWNVRTPIEESDVLLYPVPDTPRCILTLVSVYREPHL